MLAWGIVDEIQEIKSPVIAGDLLGFNRYSYLHLPQLYWHLSLSAGFDKQKPKAFDKSLHGPPDAVGSNALTSLFLGDAVKALIVGVSHFFFLADVVLGPPKRTCRSAETLVSKASS